MFKITAEFTILHYNFLFIQDENNKMGILQYVIPIVYIMKIEFIFRTTL